MSEPGQKLRLGALIALVVGSMIGGGIFSLTSVIIIAGRNSERTALRTQ